MAGFRRRLRSPSCQRRQSLPRRKPDDRPFAPVGVSSNSSLLPGPQRGSAFTTTEAGASLDLDWPTSAVHGDLTGGYDYYFADHYSDAILRIAGRGGQISMAELADTSNAESSDLQLRGRSRSSSGPLERVGSTRCRLIPAFVPRLLDWKRRAIRPFAFCTRHLGDQDNSRSRHTY